MVISNNIKELVACLLVDIIAVGSFYLLFFVSDFSFMLSISAGLGVGLIIGMILMEMWNDKVEKDLKTHQKILINSLYNRNDKDEN